MSGSAGSVGISASILRDSSAPRSERVLPPQCREAGEVAVGGAQRQAVFDGQGGQVRVGDEVRAPGGLVQEPSEGLSVALGRHRNPDRVLIEPILDLPPGGTEGLRALEDSRIRSEEHTSELQSLAYLVCRLLLEKKKRSRRCE